MWVAVLETKELRCQNISVNLLCSEINPAFMTRSIIVYIVARLLSGRCRFGIPAGEGYFFLISKTSRYAVGSTDLPSSGNRSSFPGLNRPGPEVDHFPPSKAGDEN